MDQLRIGSVEVNRCSGGKLSQEMDSLTLFCCESIQKTLGCLCRSTPLLHTRSRSPQRRRPGPHRTFCGREASVSGITAASVSSGPQENWSPGTRTWPTFSVRLLNISSSFFCFVVRCFSSAAMRYGGPQYVRHKPEAETGVTVAKSVLQKVLSCFYCLFLVILFFFALLCFMFYIFCFNTYFGEIPFNLVVKLL